MRHASGIETMSALDASILHVEDAVSHMHIGSVGIFEGPALPQDFHLTYHVRRTALPAPGGDEELRTLVGRVMAQKLDRSKPLWEMWIAEGLSDGRWALVNKLHHCMVDGVSGTDLLSAVFDDERRSPVDEIPPWDPAPEPSTPRSVGSALAHRANTPCVGARASGRRQGHPDRARRHRQRRRSHRGRAVAASRCIPRRPSGALRCRAGRYRRPGVIGRSISTPSVLTPSGSGMSRRSTSRNPKAR